MVRFGTTNNLKITHEALAEQLVCVYNKNESVSNKIAEDVTAGSALKGLWVCDKPELGHGAYVAVIKDNAKKNGTGCPTCAGKRVESGINDLQTTHPQIAELVVHIYRKDGSISDKTVQDVSAGSNLKAEFSCPKPELGHGTSITTIKNRTNGRGCPACAGKRAIAGRNDLQTTHPQIAELVVHIYRKDGSISDKTVQDVSAGSNLKAEFSCPKPELGHGTSITTIKNRANGSGCHVCAGKRVESGINDLQTTHPQIAELVIKIYHKDGTVSDKTVQDVSAGSNLKAEFSCPKPELGHGTSVTEISSRTRYGCPFCTTGKTEGLFRESFNQHTNNNFASTRIPLDRKSFKSGMIQIDMLCDNLNLVVEYDGTWAHGGVNNANKDITAEECLSRDIESTIALIKAGYKVIRIRDHSRDEKLQFIEISEEFADNLYQVTYKSFGKDKTNIDSLVKKIIKAKQDWF